MPIEVKKQRLAYAICDFLQKSIEDKTIGDDDAEGIEGILH